MQKLVSVLITFTSLTLFIGGIVLLILPIPFWSYFLGVPAIMIGISFIVLTFEKLSDQIIEEELKNIGSNRNAAKKGGEDKNY